MAAVQASSRKHVVRACDRCKFKKVKCDGLQPCSRCRNEDSICNYFAKRRDNGLRSVPAGYVEQLELQQSALVRALRECRRQKDLANGLRLRSDSELDIHKLMLGGLGSSEETTNPNPNPIAFGSHEQPAASDAAQSPWQPPSFHGSHAGFALTSETEPAMLSHADRGRASTTAVVHHIKRQPQTQSGGLESSKSEGTLKPHKPVTDGGGGVAMRGSAALSPSQPHMWVQDAQPQWRTQSEAASDQDTSTTGSSLSPYSVEYPLAGQQRFASSAMSVPVTGFSAMYQNSLRGSPSSASPVPSARSAEYSIPPSSWRDTSAGMTGIPLTQASTFPEVSRDGVPPFDISSERTSANISNSWQGIPPTAGGMLLTQIPTPAEMTRDSIYYTSSSGLSASSEGTPYEVTGRPSALHPRNLAPPHRQACGNWTDQPPGTHHANEQFTTAANGLEDWQTAEPEREVSMTQRQIRRGKGHLGRLATVTSNYRPMVWTQRPSNWYTLLDRSSQEE